MADRAARSLSYPLTGLDQFDIVQFGPGSIEDRMQFDQLRQREFITLLSGTAALWPSPLGAQQAARTFQVGFLYPNPQAAAPPRIAAYSSGLQAGGVGRDRKSTR